MEWEERLKVTQGAMALLHPFVGSWAGEGTDHGEPVEARLEIMPALDGSFLLARERVGDHEDLTIYRFEPEERRYVVMHLMAGAWVKEYPVEPTMGGFVWLTPPTEPSVEWVAAGDDEIRSEVTFPGALGPAVILRYRRVPAKVPAKA